MFKTHTFGGTVIYECPHCPYDDERLPVLKQHIADRHPSPPTHRPPAATLYTGDGNLVTAVPISAAPDAAPEMSEDIHFHPEETT